MYQSLSVGMLASAFVSLIFGSPFIVAGALIAAGLFAVADAMQHQIQTTPTVQDVVPGEAGSALDRVGGSI